MRLLEWLTYMRPFHFPASDDSPERYRILRRNFIGLMLLVTLVPLFFMAAVNYHGYKAALREEIVTPLRALVNKTKHSFELFLAERVSAVSFIASAYTPQELASSNNLNRIFGVMKQEYKGFIDLGLIDSRGMQVSYVGPYELLGRDYSEQPWFHEVQIKGSYVSDVFMGFRRFPHVAIAVQHRDEAGQVWTIRATIDTAKFNDLISSMGLEPTSDAFLVNKDGLLQTPSKWYGSVLDHLPLPIPPVSYEPNIVEGVDSQRGNVVISYTYFVQFPYVLVAVRPQGQVLRSWYALKSELFFLLLGSTVIIVIVIFRLTDVLVKRLREADERREAAFRELEHSHKLSSIGRLAAGVAHEINNPLAIINEKAGLIKDLTEISADFPERGRFQTLSDDILHSVNRCRSITHRLLGFARRMEVQIEVLDVNEVVRETFTFLEKEAMNRNIDVKLELSEELSKIDSDRGQLQQVFLNLLNNAFAAVSDGGVVSIRSAERENEMIGVTVEDNGCGMSEETMRHIFEPFFTTKGTAGTGLGLPITYGIVKKLGGDIEVKSKEGVGTSMTVILPRRHQQGSGDQA